MEKRLYHPIEKEIVYPTGQSFIAVDSTINGVLPFKLVMYQVDQKALNEAYNHNPNHFQHNVITNLIVDVNWHRLRNKRSCFLENVQKPFDKHCQL